MTHSNGKKWRVINLGGWPHFFKVAVKWYGEGEWIQKDNKASQDNTDFTHKLTTRRKRSSRRENLTSVLTEEQFQIVPKEVMHPQLIQIVLLSHRTHKYGPHENRKYAKLSRV